MSVSSICHVLHIIDGSTEETVDVIELTTFDLEAFKRQFDVSHQSDPMMLDRYVVGPDDVPFLNRYVISPIAFDFTAFGYWIEAVRRQ
jgi:hypothetical protein